MAVALDLLLGASAWPKVARLPYETSISLYRTYTSLQVKAVSDAAAQREAALQAALDEARAVAAAAASSSSADEGSLAALLAEREAELENLQAALGELSYEVRARMPCEGGGEFPYAAMIVLAVQ